MQALIFVPGTMGTELHSADGELLWPPKLLETQLGYGRIDKLMAEGVTAGDIIRKVSCVNFYSSIFDQFDDLGFKPGDPSKRLYTLPYDWRLDLEPTSQALAALLDTVHAEGATEIHVVAHSMGGLISRLVLEPPTYRERPWFASLRSFIALAVPHKGAPLALARVLGLDSALGISKGDFKRLTADPRYPSGYQLLPAPGEVACWNQEDAGLAQVDLYDADAAGALGLDAALMKRTRFVHDTLDKGSRPDHVRYFYFAGTGHETITRVNVKGSENGHYKLDAMVVTRSEAAGDGTVPMWSALPRAGQKHMVVNEHSSVFTGMAFKTVFYRLLGGDLGDALQSIERGNIPDPDALRLSIPTHVIECGKSFEVLLVPRLPLAAIEGSLMLRRLDDQGEALPAAAEPLAEVVYHGAPVSTLRLVMPALAQRGLYQLSFEGEPAGTNDLRFAVVDFRAGAVHP